MDTGESQPSDYALVRSNLRIVGRTGHQAKLQEPFWYGWAGDRTHLGEESHAVSGEDRFPRDLHRPPNDGPLTVRCFVRMSRRNHCGVSGFRGSGLTSDAGKLFDFAPADDQRRIACDRDRSRFYWLTIPIIPLRRTAIPGAPPPLWTGAGAELPNRPKKSWPRAGTS